jgi:hypothetical protein
MNIERKLLSIGVDCKGFVNRKPESLSSLRIGLQIEINFPLLFEGGGEFRNGGLAT